MSALSRARVLLAFSPSVCYSDRCLTYSSQAVRFFLFVSLFLINNILKIAILFVVINVYCSRCNDCLGYNETDGVFSIVFKRKSFFYHCTFVVTFLLGFSLLCYLHCILVLWRSFSNSLLQIKNIVASQTCSLMVNLKLVRLAFL